MALTKVVTQDKIEVVGECRAVQELSTQNTALAARIQALEDA
jgi:hypothetical protein|tara:strand:+ start:475 stop:600 length:126 start_codon:yes stop_codon:yes gene_type:complete